MKLQNQKYSTLLTFGFIIGLILLLLNDFYLKETYHNWVTGKLSDFAGLFIFPIFLTWILPSKIKANFILTGFFFIFWKSGLSTSLISGVNAILGSSFHRVIDFSDLVALGILPFSYLYIKSAKPIKMTFLQPVLASVAIFSFVATSASPGPPESNVIVGRYIGSWDRNTEAQIYTINFRGVDCSNCTDVVIGPHVSEYGYNENFIVAKVHEGTTEKINLKKSSYSIIVVSKDEKSNDVKQIVFRNMDDNNYEMKRKELSIPDSVQCTVEHDN